MDPLQSKSQRFLFGLALALVAGGLGVALRNANDFRGTAITRASYDWQHRLGAAALPANAPVVIVYLDERSYRDRQLDPSQPWPRALHAQLLRRLKSAGARAAVFDIAFNSPGASPEGDREFASAIRDFGAVILAQELDNNASHAASETHEGARLQQPVPVHGPFAEAAAGTGLVIQAVDADFEVRRYVAGFPVENKASLTWATALHLGLTVTKSPDAMSQANGRWVRYYGPALTISHVDFSEALAPGGVPDAFFQDKIVFIGARPALEGFRERKDQFRNPHGSWDNKELFMPGVEVHATEMLNLIRQEWLGRGSDRSEILWLWVCACLCGCGFPWLRPIPAALAALGVGLLISIVALAQFAHGIWFPWLIPVAAQIPLALGGSALFQTREWLAARKRFLTAQRIADAKIREQAALIDKAHDAILVQDLAGRVDYANPSAERLYGWSVAELRRPGGAERLAALDLAQFAAARETVLRTGEWNGELRQETKVGAQVIVASRWTLIRDEAGAPKALLIINGDITEQKQLEAQFLRTQRMNTIGALAGGMAHDLNNALAPILMGAQLLRRRTDDAEARSLIALIEASTYRSADMVRQVLLFARGRGGERERLDLAPAVKEVEKMVRETFPKRIAVESYLPRDLWPVCGNPTQLHQVLLNLCVNARDAMPSGGRLSFAADNVTLDAVEAARLPDLAPGEYVSLLVSDTGTGMPPEVQAKIFEPFFTTKAEGQGTGIGLATVLRIVKAHGGALRLESAPGQGTTFEVLLPRAPEAVPPAAAPAPDTIPLGRGELILVADDELAVRQLVEAGLVGHGYRVLTAANGAEVLQLYKQHQAEVRLLFTDGAMPELDGAATITQVRAIQPRLPVILASGETELATAEVANVARLPKPFSLEELLSLVRRVLDAG